MNAQFLVKLHTFSYLGSIHRRRLALVFDLPTYFILPAFCGAIHSISKPTTLLAEINGG